MIYTMYMGRRRSQDVGMEGGGLYQTLLNENTQQLRVIIHFYCYSDCVWN